MNNDNIDRNIPGRGGFNILNRVREDMEVYDVNGDHVGDVEFVFLGSASPDAAESGLGPMTVDEPRTRDENLVDLIASVFRGDDMPEVLRDRLLYSGFVRVDGAGLLASDRYVTPEQIASVTGERVNLSVSRKELIKD
jgi:hypothetical protein